MVFIYITHPNRQMFFHSPLIISKQKQVLSPEMGTNETIMNEKVVKTIVMVKKICNFKDFIMKLILWKGHIY